MEELALLPSLTHLTYSYPPTLEVLEYTLRACKKLRLLIILDKGALETVKALPKREIRVVVAHNWVRDWVGDWVFGAGGGKDVWMSAEAVVISRIAEGGVLEC